MAVASTGPYGNNLHLAPVTELRQQSNTPSLNFYRQYAFPDAQTTVLKHTHPNPFNGSVSGCASTRKVKPIWILLKQLTVSGSGISWVPDALPAAQPTVSKH